jgi:hypothetical protein
MPSINLLAGDTHVEVVFEAGLTDSVSEARQVKKASWIKDSALNC